MGVVGKGLSVDGALYFRDIIRGDEPFEITEFGRQIAKLTGHYKILDFTTGMGGLQEFLFRTPKWPIGGVYFDGIMQTEHVRRVKPTQYPVQTGVQMTDHAIIEPAELTIDVMMSDAETHTYTSMNPLLNAIYQAAQTVMMYKNLSSLCKLPPAILGDGRAAMTWRTLEAMLISRVPIHVDTRLEQYDNMIITEINAPDDVKTLNAFRCTIRMQEIFYAEAAETKTSARAAATNSQTSGGQTPVQTGDGVNKTAAKAGAEKIGVV